jgi:hypothetical protein
MTQPAQMNTQVAWASLFMGFPRDMGMATGARLVKGRPKQLASC